ncbi:MAG: hypothetical protein JST75_11235 [Bacteroidetes bacterium]|nr:hypothetical protein [Bacteroidota bacterium]
MQLQEVKLQTNNAGELFRFYKDVFELNAVQNSLSTQITIGKSFLIFEETNVHEQPFYHFAFNIPSNKIAEAFEWTKKRVDIIWLDEFNSYFADFKSWNAKSFYFLDPAGNIGELIARFDMHDTVEEDFSAQQIRNVSEIGLVFPSKTFSQDADSIVKKFELGFFEKQPPLEHFKAIGDDEGLFVCVPQNRNWFSTILPANIFPISVKFQHRGKDHHLKM